MLLSEAVKILKAHNNWRRGVDENGNEIDDAVAMTMPMQNPKEIGEAIDVVVDYVELDIVMSNKNDI